MTPKQRLRENPDLIGTIISEAEKVLNCSFPEPIIENLINDTFKFKRIDYWEEKPFSFNGSWTHNFYSIEQGIIESPSNLEPFESTIKIGNAKITTRDNLAYVKIDFFADDFCFFDKRHTFKFSVPYSLLN